MGNWLELPHNEEKMNKYWLKNRYLGVIRVYFIINKFSGENLLIVDTVLVHLAARKPWF